MFIDRFRYQATKAAQVQSRIKMLEKVVPIEVPPERKRIHFDFPTCAKSGRTVLELKHARKAYGDLVVFDDVNLHIERGDRIALVGPNGAGKSTLMRMLSGEEAPDAGERIEGHNVVMQYFAQDEATRHGSGADRLRDARRPARRMHMVPAIRNILGGFLFSGDDVYKKVRVLSGGERTRLAVARMLLRPSNTLLLDEPTNHLDLDSKDVLLDALVDYGGTLIFVSHDRYFVERLATKIIEVGHGDGGRLSRAPTRSSSGTRSIRQEPRATAGAGRRSERDRTKRGIAQGRHAGARSRQPANGRPRQPASGRAASDRHRDDKKRADAEARKTAARRRRRGRREIDDARNADRRRRSGASASSNRRWPRPGSTTTATRRSRSSTGIRR